MNYASIIIPFVGGLGMFIYGMQIMAQGLENAAGSRMKSLLEALTKNKLFGVMLGAFITAVIQSSSATTVMVVGFVNAGIMNLSQAMGVIMGANIGTTVTGWLVSSVEWAKFLSPANLAPIAIIIGVIIMLTGKRRSSKDISSIIVEGANGGLHTNYEGKADAAIHALLEDGYDFAYVHVEAPDEMGHMGSMTDKITAIENVDGRVVARIMEAMDRSGEDYRLMILPDHPTPICVRTHTSEPVPYMIYDSRKAIDGIHTYNEKEAAKSTCIWKDGYRLIDHLLEC